jgi:hypothetical protein
MSTLLQQMIENVGTEFLSSDITEQEAVPTTNDEPAIFPDFDHVTSWK